MKTYIMLKHMVKTRYVQVDKKSKVNGLQRNNMNEAIIHGISLQPIL